MSERRVEIIKQPVVVLGEGDYYTESEDYLNFTDKAGTEYRLKKKNRDESVDLIKNNPGKAVKLNYGNYMNTDFIHYVSAVEGELPPEVTPVTPVVKDIPTTKPSGQEVGLWWKEIGEMLRCGDIDTSKSHGKLVRAAYYAQMFSVLDIKFEKIEKEE